MTKRITSKWNEAKVIKELLELDGNDLSNKVLRKEHSGLHSACIRIFGSRKKALLAAGLDYEDTLKTIPWTKDRVLSTIQTLYLNNTPINFKFINSYHSILRKKAEKFFGSWGNAVDAAGLNYEDVKKNNVWVKPYLAEDGILYASQTEGLIADCLYKMRGNNLIKEYVPQEIIAAGKNWASSFSVILNNNAKLWLEVDVSDYRKKKEQFEEKLTFLDKANYFYCKVSSHTSLQNIIERYTLWYTIPQVNTLITSHINPDGDAISSMVAVYKHIKATGNQVVIKAHGEIPKNLAWMFEGIDIVKKIPDWVENIVVLDCGVERIGWEIPKGLPVFNIDHHISRVEDNDPDNNIHVIKACSTAGLLYTRFGIKDELLLVGVYTDTLFTKSISEVFHLINEFNIDEDKMSEFLSKINSNPDKKIWNLLSKTKVNRFKNGFLFAELEDFGAPDAIEVLMQILFKVSESVCLIYGKNKMVKLRTSNISLDLSKVAEEYGGGGHPYAAACQINSISEFKIAIRSLQVCKSQDGYEEGKNV
jgi:phosphoesterase RecJ-like protein